MEIVCWKLLSFTPALGTCFYNHVTVTESKTKDRRQIMAIAVRFTVLARWDLLLEEFAREFSGLAVWTGLDDATLNSLFWIGAKYHRPMDLPDTTGLSWREGILRCLESVQPRSRTSPPAAALSRPLFAGKLSPPLLVAHSSPPSATPKSCPPPSAAPKSSPPPSAAQVPLGILVIYDGMFWSPECYP